MSSEATGVDRLTVLFANHSLSLAGLCVTMLLTGLAKGAQVEGKADPATVRRGDALTITLTMSGRVAGDRVDHYMLWTTGQPVPNPLRIEGPNYIIADGSKNGAFVLDVSLWPDGVYTIYGRGYYYAGADAAMQRLDTTVKVRVQGGPEPPRFVVTPVRTTVTPGDSLQLQIKAEHAERLGAAESVTLVSRGQQVRSGRMPPLNQSEFPIAAVKLGENNVPTDGWRPQVLRCLAVKAQFHVTDQQELLSFTAPVPPITVVPKEGTADPRLVPSYRGDRMIHLLTTGPEMHTFPYPTCQSWRAGGQDVFCETDGPRPDGTRVRGERQLVMVDVATGQQTHLATLGVEDTAQYGQFHVSASSQYHTDYAPGADLLVYYDMTGHHLYTLHPGAKPVEVWHETSGTIGDPPAITRDGTRICFYVISPGPTPSRYFTGRTSSIFELDIDPKTGKAIGTPRMVLAYPWRKSPFADGPVDWRSTIAVDHVQICPTDRDRIGYAHEGGYPRNGEPENTRVWTVRADGSDNRSLSPAEEKGTYYTHELFGASGKYEYAVWGGSVVRLTVANGEFHCIYKEEGALRATHLAVSPDEKWFAADIFGGLGTDCDGTPIGGLFLIEAATGKATFLAAFPAGSSHPRHVHPNFSPDGKKVGFTMAVGRSGSEIAYVDVSDIVTEQR